MVFTPSWGVLLLNHNKEVLAINIHMGCMEHFNLRWDLLVPFWSGL
jgi:hypothetical protein